MRSPTTEPRPLTANSRRRSAVAAILGVLAALGLMVTTAAPSSALPPGYTLRTHFCDNPTTVSNGIRAGLCGDIATSGNTVFGVGEVFCQDASSPYTERRCTGEIQGVDIWRQIGTGAWTQIVHSSNYSCGSISGGTHVTTCAAPPNRNYLATSSGTPYNTGTCYRFYAVSRASIAISSSVTISGARLQSPVWATPACSG